jgi:hypothetical protein
MYRRCYNRRCKLPAAYKCDICGQPYCPSDSEFVRWAELTKEGIKWHDSLLCLTCLRQKMMEGNELGGKEWLSTIIRMKRQVRRQMHRAPAIQQEAR